jgi:class 3 adenylate cyclase
MTTTTAAKQAAANNAFLSQVKRVMGPAVFREAARLVNAEGEAAAWSARPRRPPPPRRPRPRP